MDAIRKFRLRAGCQRDLSGDGRMGWPQRGGFLGKSVLRQFPSPSCANRLLFLEETHCAKQSKRLSLSPSNRPCKTFVWLNSNWESAILRIPCHALQLEVNGVRTDAN